jgi:hypothetical protein
MLAGRLPADPLGTSGAMIFAAISLLGLAVLLVFLFPWAGIVAGAAASDRRS